MISRQETGTVLESMGLRPAGVDAWTGLHQVRGRTFLVSVNTTPVYTQVIVRLNLVTTCNQPALHRYFAEVNGKIALGKFAVGPEQQGSRPLVLIVDLPAGAEPEYTAREALHMLFGIAFRLVEEHYDHIEALVREGCASDVTGSQWPGSWLLERLRAARSGDTTTTTGKDER